MLSFFSLQLTSSSYPWISILHTMSWGNPCHFFERRRLSASVLSAKESLQPSDPEKCAAL